LTSEIEHTSNNLPWRYNTPARVLTCAANDTGALDLEHLEQLFASTPAGQIACGDRGFNLTATARPVRAGRPLPPGRRVAVRGPPLSWPAPALDMVEAGVDALAFSAHKSMRRSGSVCCRCRARVLAASPRIPAVFHRHDLRQWRVVWRRGERTRPGLERHRS